MKALKGSLVALVAILAVGLTVAMQAGAFESKAVRVNECYFGVTTLDPLNNCAQKTAIECDDIVTNEPIFSLSTTVLTDQGQIDEECPGGSTFCCVKIVQGARLCTQPQIDPAGAPALGYYRVASIFCQP